MPIRLDKHQCTVQRPGLEVYYSCFHDTAQGSSNMRVRPTILPLPLNEQRVQHLTDLADAIVAAMNAGDDPLRLIAEFNTAAACNLDVAAFHGAWEGSGTRTLVETVLRPAPAKVADITDHELLEIITYLMEGKGTESEESYWLDFLDRNLPHPAISDLIYYEDLTPAEVLQRTKSYQPILL